MVDIGSDRTWILVLLVAFFLSLTGDQGRVRTIATRQITTMAKTRELDEPSDILSNSVWILVELVTFFLSLPGD